MKNLRLPRPARSARLSRRYPAVILLSLAVCAGLVACGGGGGGGDEPTATPVGNEPLVAGSAPALASGDNSYRNFKAIGLEPQALPENGDARAYGDFAGNGRTDVFIATPTYDVAQPQSATPAQFSIWRRQPDNVTLVQDSSLLNTSQGCVHPRKALVADFNGDGRRDIFVACHGVDAPPYSGERNKIVLSQSGGGYVVADASTDVGYFHSAAAADLDADGDVDVIAIDRADPHAVIVLLNDGSGQFVRETGRRVPVAVAGKPYYTVELADVDEDGQLDLLLGGHEWEGAPTVVYPNPGDNVFANAAPITIPEIASSGIVLDFVVTGTAGSRKVWVLRTSGGNGSATYQSRVVQTYTLATQASAKVLDDNPQTWVRWIIPSMLSGNDVITSDRAFDGFSIIY